MAKQLLLLMGACSLAAMVPQPRFVDELDQPAFEQAQRDDPTAIKAFTNIPILTVDGRCLFVDQLSGDERANFTPVQVGECGTTDGQGWDIVTQGIHNDLPGSMLIASNLTGACMNFDPRGRDVFLFSCGGRYDGSGSVTASQLFGYDEDCPYVVDDPEDDDPEDDCHGPMQLVPKSGYGIFCLHVWENHVGIARCEEDNENELFMLGDEDDLDELSTLG
ncbi:hypothetical protein F4780DRAFT_755126 [Xylariomycetidae sp. FL0641]|nr:hypothetical protein F4780DRAFT_755126 [Xylariomycetidae sp. FL0641]